MAFISDVTAVFAKYMRPANLLCL